MYRLLIALILIATVSHAQLPTGTVTRTATEAYVTNKTTQAVNAHATNATAHAALLAGKVSTNDATYLDTVSKAGTAWQNPPSATNWTWVINEDGRGVTLTSYNFSSMDVIVPDRIDGLPVTSFAANIFAPDPFGSSITSIKGCDNITTIQPWSFSFCIALKTVNLPNIESIGDNAFFGCISLTNVVFNKNAPSVGSEIYGGIPENQVINSVESSTALNWGTTLGGMPVVRMGTTQGTCIIIGSATLGGVERSTWPEAGTGGTGDSAVWKPINNLATGAVVTLVWGTTNRVDYVDIRAPVTITNSFPIAMNCTTNFYKEGWLNVLTNNPSIVFDSRIEWQQGAPEFTCTGLYKFAFSTACGTRIQGRQIWPTVYKSVYVYNPDAVNQLEPTFGGKYSISLAAAASLTNYVIFTRVYNVPTIVDFWLFLAVASDATNTTTCIISPIVNGTVQTTYGSTNDLDKTSARMKKISFMIPTSYTPTLTVEVIRLLTIKDKVFSNVILSNGCFQRPATEEEIKAYSAGWRP